MPVLPPLHTRTIAPWVLLMLLVLPWINPLAGGPTPAVFPWLVSAACAVMVWFLRPQLTVKTVAASWLLAALLSAGMGLLQYFGLAQSWMPWVHVTVLGEAFANLRQRNQFATLTSIGLLALLWQVAQCRAASASASPAGAQRGLLLGAMVLAALLALGNAASGSRTGLLQWFCVAGLTTLWAAPRKQWHLVALGGGALAVYLLAALALPGVLELLTGTRGGGVLGRFNEEAGCHSRRVLWANVLHLIAEKPWFGWGWGGLNFAHFITLYPNYPEDENARFCEILDNAHNLPLHLAVTLGPALSLAVCIAGLWLTWRAKPWQEANPTRQLAWGVLAVVLLHSLLEYPLWYGPFQIAVGLSVWLLHTQKTCRAGVQQKVMLAPVLRALIAAFSVAVLAYAAWDYERVSQVYKDPPQRRAAYLSNTLEKIRDSWLFDQQVRFAELSLTPLDAASAAHINALAQEVLHFSPEALVAEKLIESAVLLGHDEEALFFLQRLRLAYPDEYARWANHNARALNAPSPLALARPAP